MKKIILSIPVFMLAFNVMAQEANDAQKFPAIKSMVMQSIEKREQILNEEKDCVNKSQQKKELKDCFKMANEKRQSVGLQIKMRIKAQQQQ